MCFPSMLTASGGGGQLRVLVTFLIDQTRGYSTCVAALATWRLPCTVEQGSPRQEFWVRIFLTPCCLGQATSRQRLHCAGSKRTPYACLLPTIISISSRQRSDFATWRITMLDFMRFCGCCVVVVSAESLISPSLTVLLGACTGFTSNACCPRSVRLFLW